jgi:hypothetical protein
MEQTLPPLVSDEQIETEANEWREGERGITIAHRMCFFSGAEWMRSECEADRQRTREVVQALVDALGELRYGAELGAIEWDCQCEEDAGITCGPCGSFERGDAALALAKSINIKPTKP